MYTAVRRTHTAGKLAPSVIMKPSSPAVSMGNFSHGVFVPETAGNGLESLKMRSVDFE